MEENTAEGQLQFPRTITEDGEGFELMGYRMGNGRSPIFSQYADDKPVIRIVSDEDARTIQSRWQYIQMECLAGNWPEQVYEDLWKGVTLLPMQAEPIVYWPGEELKREAAAAYEKWKEENPEVAWKAEEAAQAARDVEWEAGRAQREADRAENVDVAVATN